MTSCLICSFSTSFAILNVGSRSIKYAYCFKVSKQKECKVDMDALCNRDNCFFQSQAHSYTHFLGCCVCKCDHNQRVYVNRVIFFKELLNNSFNENSCFSRTSCS